MKSELPVEDCYAEFMGHETTWFDQQYLSRLHRRFATFKLALQYAVRARKGPEVVILETGCVRRINDYSAGYSTVVFGEFLARYGGRLHTVDINPLFLELCKELTRPYAHVIDYHLSDSVTYLANRALRSQAEKIDLLYLDSYDYPLLEKNVEEEIQRCQSHCLAELTMALPCLHETSTVLIDDSDLPGGGKALLAKQLLTEHGWTCVFDDYQTLWTPSL